MSINDFLLFLKRVITGILWFFLGIFILTIVIGLMS